MQPEKSNRYIYLISFIAALGGLMFGFDIAIISGAVPFIKEYFQLDELQLGWAVSSLLVGCIFGSVVAGKLSDRIGRKRLLIWIALIFAVTSIVTAIAQSFPLFIFGRLIGGLAVGAASVISPLYIAEVAPHFIRGKLVSLNQLAITIGIFVSYFINYMLHDIGEDSWRWMFASGAIPSVIFFGLLFLVPESPRWLLYAGRKLEALKIFKKIGGDNASLDDISSHERTAKNESGGLSDLVNPKYRKPLMVGIFLAVLIQITGINTVIDYAPIILKSAGETIDTALFQTFIIGFINFAFTFIAIFTIDRIGRKPLYIAGSIGMSLSLLLLSLGFFFDFVQGVYGLILLLLFIGFFAACIGPTFWVLLSEMFPGKIRGVAISVAVFTNWLMNFLVVLFFPYVLQNFGGGVTFGILSLMAALMIVFTVLFIPETKGKSLEEIDKQWLIDRAK